MAKQYGNNLREKGDLVPSDIYELMKKDQLVIPNYKNLIDDESDFQVFAKNFDLGNITLHKFGPNSEHLVLQTEKMINPLKRLALRQQGVGIYWGNDYIDNFGVRNMNPNQKPATVKPQQPQQNYGNDLKPIK